jgi:hypothetical protein
LACQDELFVNNLIDVRKNDDDDDFDFALRLCLRLGEFGLSVCGS